MLIERDYYCEDCHYTWPEEVRREGLCWPQHNCTPLRIAPPS
jgi:hypothetical protein